MLNSRLGSVVAWLLTLLCGHGAEPLSSEAARTALARATQYLTSISTEGGYLWRYSTNLRERWGEEQATATQIWVQPPGTPAVGEAFLAAYRATGDDLHLRAAQAAAQALVRGQLKSGGWAYLVEFDPDKRGAWAYRTDSSSRPPKKAAARNTTTFDDNNTQSALRFLLAFLDTATNQPALEVRSIREALDFGLTQMIAAQYPVGAWPQRWEGQPHDPAQHPVRTARISSEWPRTWPRASYGAFYTLNDGAQLDCIETLLEAFHQLGDDRYLEAARRGGDFLILAQLPEPQPGWAQQYNFHMEPAWARAFEPPAVCSSESAVAARTLIKMYVETGDKKYLEPLPSFMDWLKRSQLEPQRWARLYELGSNKPLYGDRDGQIHYTLAEISAERQTGYGWQGSFGVPGVMKDYEDLLRQGREAFASSQSGETDRRRPAASRVARVLAEQDEQGRWIQDGWVDLRTFAQNMRTLAAYLESEATLHQP